MDWTLKRGILVNRDSAAISVPAQLREEQCYGKSVFTWRSDLLSSEEVSRGRSYEALSWNRGG